MQQRIYRKGLASVESPFFIEELSGKKILRPGKIFLYFLLILNNPGYGKLSVLVYVGE